MSSAANNIEAKSRTLREVLDTKKYEIDYFQREYRWERHHIEQLLFDLTTSFFSNYKPGDTTEKVSNYNSYLIIKKIININLSLNLQSNLYLKSPSNIKIKLSF